LDTWEFAGKAVALSDFAGVLFHSPYSKLVQKALARLAFTDYLERKSKSCDGFVSCPELDAYRYE